MDTREIVMPTGGSSDGLLGGGGIGALLIGALLFGGGLGGFGGNRGYNTPAASAVASDIVLNPAFQSLQNQITTLSGAIDSNQILAGLTSVNQNISGTSRDIGRDIANLSTSQAGANYTTLTSINGLGRDVTASQNQAALQSLNSFNNLTTTTLQGFNSSAMQVQNATNKIIAQGTANAAAMANCCCEIKAAISADGQATRELINNLNVQNLRDQLSAANGKVSNNEQNQYLLQAILAHLHPTVAVA